MGVFIYVSQVSALCRSMLTSQYGPVSFPNYMLPAQTIEKISFFFPSFPFSLSKYFSFCQILQIHKALECRTHDPSCLILSHIFSLFSFNFFI